MIRTRTHKNSSQLKSFQADEAKIQTQLVQFQDLAWRIIVSGKKNNGYLPPQFVEELEQLINNN